MVNNMGYVLTCHTLWNEKHTPFLLCKYKREDSVRNTYNFCRLFNHKEYLSLKEKSSKQLHSKTRERQEKGKQYDLDAHHAWTEKHNQSISHFGIEPNQLQLGNLRFDIST